MKSPKRQRWHCPTIGGDSATGDDGEERWVQRNGNLIGSTVDVDGGPEVELHIARRNCEAAMHMPTLDIDMMCHLKESETPGHFHLMIDKLMPWPDYEKLLKVMGEVGILEEGYVRSSLARKASFVAREPWKDKK